MKVIMDEIGFRKKSQTVRIYVGIVLAILGLVVFILGINPDLFGMDRSPVIGFLQIAVFLIGMAMICMGGYIALNTLWNGTEKTIIADIGFRLVATGYVVCTTSGMADVFGLGHHIMPSIPFFGPFQAAGFIVGEVMVALGFVLMIPLVSRRQSPREL